MAPARFHGFLIIDKPAGWTSHDVVGRLRRLTGQRQIGHAGTLDPAATGVLPVALGDATKTLEFLAGAGKTYLADVTFGVTTDSDDIDGRVVTVAPYAHLDREEVETALAKFRGELLQIPPRYAAVRVGGRRMYELARQGVEIEVEPRPVTIHELELLSWDPPVATLLVDCSKGTYIRSLARDLGSKLGCGAYLSNLVRLRAGPFTLCEAWTIVELEALDLAAEWPDIARHPDVALEAWPACLLDDASIQRWHNGQAIPCELPADGHVGCRVYDDDGQWHGVGRWSADARTLKPNKVVGAG